MTRSDEAIKDALLSNALDFLYDLRGEWHWKKDEPRAGNQKQYEALLTLIEEISLELRE